MQRLQAYKYELRPDGQQERQMRRFAGACRFVYNKGLALQKERYERGLKVMGWGRDEIARWCIENRPQGVLSR